MAKRKTLSTSDDGIVRKNSTGRFSVKKSKNNEKKSTNSTSIICDVCKKQFTKNVTLRKHLKRVHKMEPTIKGRHCDICQQEYYQKYEEHLQNEHGIPIEIENLRFRSMEEFGLWKEFYEKETCSWYVNGVSDTCAYRSGRLFRYYYCNSRGRAKLVAKDGRKRERKQSRKIGSMCPSKICVKQVADDNFVVHVIRTHVGHELNLRNINIPKSEKEKVIEWLNEEIHADIIVERVRREWKKIGFDKQICSRDIHNIYKESKIQKRFIIRQDLESTLKMWISELNTMKPSPLLFVKNRDDPVNCSSLLNPDDFIMVISTENQAELLKKYGSGGVLSIQSTTDLTHNCSWQLFILTVLVDNQKFYPVAYMYSTRSDSAVFRNMFIALRQRFGPIHPKAFFVDDNPRNAFLDVWTSVMGVQSYKILYSGSFLDTWMENFPPMLPETKREEIRSYLNTILNENDQTKFQTNVKMFNNMCHADYELYNFRCFLEKNYFHQYQMWAKCFVMPFLGISPSVDHNPLNDAYKQSWVFLQQIFKLGNGYRKLDKAIALILKLDYCDYRMDKVFDVDPESAKNINRQQKTYHEEMEKQKDNYLCQKIGPREFELYHPPSMPNSKLDGRKSDANNQGKMKVKFKPGVKCSCAVRCEKCKLCFHQASCDCLDHKVRCCICRHIHYVRIHYYLPDEELMASMDDQIKTESNDQLTVTTPPMVEWPNHRSEQTLDAAKASRQCTKLLELIDEVTMRVQTIRKNVESLDYRQLQLSNLEKMTRAFQVIWKKLPTDADINVEAKPQPPLQQVDVQNEHNYS